MLPILWAVPPRFEASVVVHRVRTAESQMTFPRTVVSVDVLNRIGAPRIASPALAVLYPLLP